MVSISGEVSMREGVDITGTFVFQIWFVELLSKQKAMN